jgi:hypothetical protein
MIGVCGGSDVDVETQRQAHEVGRELAARGATIVSGGLGGVMEACCEGAHEAGGLTVGIIPGTDTSKANRHVDVAIASGMAEGRNVLIVHSAAALIALKGAFGTLSEVSLGLAMRKPVAAVGDWCPIPGVAVFTTPKDAVEHVLGALQRRTGGAT